MGNADLSSRPDRVVVRGLRVEHLVFEARKNCGHRDGRIGRAIEIQQDSSFDQRQRAARPHAGRRVAGDERETAVGVDQCQLERSLGGRRRAKFLDESAAMDALERASEAHSDWMYSVGTQPWFRPYHSHPRFIALLERLHLPPGDSPEKAKDQ